jgi:hypothetical protein
MEMELREYLYDDAESYMGSFGKSILYWNQVIPRKNDDYSLSRRTRKQEVQPIMIPDDPWYVLLM